jgi:hypothetical protein
MLDALQEVDSENLSHYDAHCPRCRRATRIPRQRLEMAMPNWREELKEFEKEMKAHPQQEAPLPEPDPFDQTQGKSSPVAEATPTPKPAAQKAATKPKPAAKPAESKPKATARQTTPSAETKKSTGRKTSTKGTSKKSK